MNWINRARRRLADIIRPKESFEIPLASASAEELKRLLSVGGGDAIRPVRFPYTEGTEQGGEEH